MSADLDFGKLALKFWGEFDLTMQYETLDCVYYDFSTYLAINTPNVGEEPSSSSAWMLMCQGYGLTSEQEVAEGVVDNKAISAKELKNNKAISEEVLAGTGDKIVTPESLRFLGGFTHTLFEVYTPGAGTWVAPDYYGDGKPYKAEVVIIGGGAGAMCEITNGSHAIGGEPGAGGGLSLLSVTIMPNKPYHYIVGAGGLSLVLNKGFLPVVVNPTAGGSSSMFEEVVTGGSLHANPRITGLSGVGNYSYSDIRYGNASNVQHLYQFTIAGVGNLTLRGVSPTSIPFNKKNAGLGAIGMAIGLHGSGTPSYTNKAFAVSNSDGFPGMINIYVRPRN